MYYVYHSPLRAIQEMDEPREARGQGYWRVAWTEAHLGPQGRHTERPDQAPSMSFSALILKPLAYFGLPVYLVHRLSQTSPLTRYYIRNILYICSVGFCSTVGFCAAIPLTLLGRRYDVNYIVARTFYATFSRLSGLRIVVEGEEYLKTRPCVIVGNHQSMLDLLYIGRCAASPVLPSPTF